MSTVPDFGETHDVAVTILVDNRADLLVRSTDTVKYFTDKPLLAEHGFAAMIDLKAAGIRILWDAGMTAFALIENTRRMALDLATIDKIVLSHGHGDHTAAVADVLKAIDVLPKARRWESTATMEELRRYAQGRRVPVIAHPAAFRERWSAEKDGARRGPYLPPSRTEWEAAGAEVILAETPYQLAPGCWTTGAVPRHSFETAGTSATMAYRDGDELHRDHVEDDQAIVIHIKGKGLVIVAGCAHAGIVNTVTYAREVSGIERVWAVIGGFHLARASDDESARTVDAIKQWQPALVAPTHCTGFKAMGRFAAQMPEAFVLSAVGTTFLF